MNVHDPVFDPEEMGDRRSAPRGGDGFRARGRESALAVTAVLVLVAAMLAVATIRVIGVGSSSDAATPKDVEGADPTYRHETPSPSEPPNSDFVAYPAEPVPTDVQPQGGVAVPGQPVEIGDVDVIVELRTGVATALPRSIAGIVSSEPHYAVSPDGRRLAFFGITPSDGYQIHVADLDGTHIRAVTSDAAADASPAWSPDGTEIVYEAGDLIAHGLVVVDVRTGQTRTVVSGLDRVTEQPWAPVFAPDGRTIVFTVRQGFDSVGADLWTVPAAGGRPSILFANAAFARFSPDGTSIACRRARSMMSTWIRISDADGRHPTQVGGTVWAWRPDWPLLGTPAWSPDGTRVAFEGRRFGRVVVANLTTGGLRAVGRGEHPVWLDDHTLIVESVPS